MRIQGEDWTFIFDPLTKAAGPLLQKVVLCRAVAWVSLRKHALHLLVRVDVGLSSEYTLVHRYDRCTCLVPHCTRGECVFVTWWHDSYGKCVQVDVADQI